MDFIEGLPKSGGYGCVQLVVDQLSKYNHFTGLCHPFSAKQVVEVFVRKIVPAPLSQIGQHIPQHILARITPS